MNRAATGAQLDFFREMGALTLSLWREADLDERRFPDIAMEVMRWMPPHECVSSPEVLREFLLSVVPPLQVPSQGFGQPALRVYSGARFVIDVLHWVDSTTDIHGHGFSGAFHVLEGSSLHASYRFEQKRRITDAFALGDVQLESVELLSQGDSRPIHGAELRHALFHLDRPSVSVVLRSKRGGLHQLSYLPPHVAVDMGWGRSATDKTQLAALTYLMQTDSPELPALLAELVAIQDPQSAFLALLRCHRHLQATGQLEGVVQAATEAHGSQVEQWMACLRESDWRSNIRALRQQVSNPQHRFLLALLMNLPFREPILASVRERFPGDPVDTMMTWVAELMVTRPDGSLDLLGIQVTPEGTPYGERLGARLGEALLLVMRHRIQGGLRASLREALATRYAGDLDPSQADEVLESWEPLSGSLFRPLFVQQP